MLLTRNNLTFENLEKAFKTPGGFSFEDVAEVRKAIGNYASNTVLAKLHAEKHGVSLYTYLSKKEYFVNRARKGIWGE